MENGKPPRVLFIEDDLALATMFNLRMQAEGFDVKHVYDGETAMQTAREYRPDLILCDLMMPNISGFEVIDILRNTMETSATKIVVISALSQPEDIEKAKQLGADDYIVKSQVMIDDVMDRLRGHLGLPPSSLKSH